MLTSVEGIYRHGHIDLIEIPAHATEDMHVIVTFLGSGDINLSERGISDGQASDLRARLSTFTEDWESPEMDIYNCYDATQPKL